MSKLRDRTDIQLDAQIRREFKEYVATCIPNAEKVGHDKVIEMMKLYLQMKDKDFVKGLVGPLQKKMKDLLENDF